MNINIPLAPMGVLAPVSAHAGPSAQPPIGTAEIFWHACLQSRFHQISPFSGQNRVDWGYIAHFGICPPKIGFFRGLGGVPEICFSLESSYFCEIGAHAKF